mgnify:FL=1
MESSKKNVYIIFGIIAVLILIISLSFLFKKDKMSDAERFAKEYDFTVNNVFVYRNLDEINKILENGTGVVYLGFPECPWCKGYVPYLNEVAINEHLDKIYYFNILNDRKNNTSGYKKTIELLNDYLKYDNEGNKRIYVPAVIAVNNGKIVGFDDESSLDTKGYETPEEYWKNEDLDGLKKRLSDMIKASFPSYCTSGCNK